MGVLDENIWVALAFIAFIVLVWKRVGAALGGMLDTRSEEIKTTLEEAQRLRDDAQKELKKYQKLNRQANEQAEQIKTNAEAAAEAIRTKVANAAEAAIKRKEKQALDKISALEAETIAELKARASEQAIAAATEIIAEKLGEKEAQKIVKKDLAEIRKIT